MAANLTDQVRSILEVTTAIALGDLSKLVNVDMQGKMPDLKITVNSMLAQLSKLGRRGSWRSSPKCKGCGRFVVHRFTRGPRANPSSLQVLTDNVHLMAMNLMNQVRSIGQATKAVVGGDLTKKIEVDVRGEILELKETVNGMTESLSLFADEVTRVARREGRKNDWEGR